MVYEELELRSILDLTAQQILMELSQKGVSADNISIEGYKDKSGYIWITKVLIITKDNSDTVLEAMRELSVDEEILIEIKEE